MTVSDLFLYMVVMPLVVIVATGLVLAAVERDRRNAGQRDCSYACTQLGHSRGVYNGKTCLCYDGELVDDQ